MSVFILIVLAMLEPTFCQYAIRPSIHPITTKRSGQRVGPADQYRIFGPREQYDISTGKEYMGGITLGKFDVHSTGAAGVGALSGSMQSLNNLHILRNKRGPHPQQYPIPYPIVVPQPQPYPIPYPVAVPQPQPQPYPIPYPVPQPQPQVYPIQYPVPVPQPHMQSRTQHVPGIYPIQTPYPVRVPQPVSVGVERPYPYSLQRPYTVPISQPYPGPVYGTFTGGAPGGAGIAGHIDCMYPSGPYDRCRGPMGYERYDDYNRSYRRPGYGMVPQMMSGRMTDRPHINFPDMDYSDRMRMFVMSRNRMGMGTWEGNPQRGMYQDFGGGINVGFGQSGEFGGGEYGGGGYGGGGYGSGGFGGGWYGSGFSGNGGGRRFGGSRSGGSNMNRDGGSGGSGGYYWENDDNDK